MSRREGHLLAALVAGAVCGLALPAYAGSTVRVFNDATADAAYRPLSLDGFSALPATAPIDLLRVDIGGWSTATPVTDPYSGSFTGTSSPHLVRVNLVLGGLVNPPGPLTGPVTPDPFRFGPRPLFGFIELDVDHERDTGGELTASAANRFLANVGRFSSLPQSSISTRAVLSGKDLDGDYQSSPQYERSGADFAIVLCGCFTPTVVSESGLQNGCLDADETMIVRGRFFQRAGGHRPASLVLGGSAPGMYDPLVDLRFSHSVATDKTTVSLVYALDMAGAASLSGTPQQSVDTLVSNHTSIEEGIQDLINRAAAPGLTGLVRELIYEWEGHTVDDSLQPRDWRASVIIGTTYTTPCGSPYLWTDIGFDCQLGDLNGDQLINAYDLAEVSSTIAALDAGPEDYDGLVNGCVVIPNFPTNFSIYDINYDGLINGLDLAFFAPECKADWDHSGVVSADDIFAFLDDWFAGNADFDGSGFTTADDIFAFLDDWFAGCP